MNVYTQGRVYEVLSLLRQLLAQLLDGAPVAVYMPDCMGWVYGLDRLRQRLEKEDVAVPAIVDPDIDPLGHMIAWRDFLQTLVRVN